MNATENDSLNKPWKVLDPTILQDLIDISYLQTEPEKIAWSIDNGDKWDYKTLKEAASKRYKVLNTPRDYREKNKNRVKLAHFIYDSFEGLKDMIAQEYDIVLESDQYKDIIRHQNPLTQELPNKLQTLVHSFYRKIREIQRDWYEDWKNFGEIDDIEPIEEKLRSKSASKRANEVKKYKKYYTALYENGRGDERDNPLKWWIKYKALPSLDTSKRLSIESKEAFLNTQKYTKDTVERTLKNYLLDIGKLPNYNLLQAYMKLEEILDYVARFGTIEYELNEERPWSFIERVSTLKISKPYDINVQMVKDLLIEIYRAFGDKFNDMVRFAEFAPRYSPHFAPYRTVNSILFELYAIRRNGELNRKNFDINAMLYKFKNNNSNVKTRKVDKVNNSVFGRALGKLGRWWRGENIYESDPIEAVPYMELGPDYIDIDEARKGVDMKKAREILDLSSTLEPVTEGDLVSLDTTPSISVPPKNDEEESEMILDNDDQAFASDEGDTFDF